MRIAAEDGPLMYMAAQYVIGIWEFHLNDLDEEFVRDQQEYNPTLFESAWKFPQLRTIPVGRSVSAQMPILPYERDEELVSGQK